MAVAVDPLERSRSAPDTVLIESALGTGELFELLLAQAGVPAGTIDAATLRVLGAAPFTTTAGFRGPRGAAPRLPRLLNWLGLSYTVMHGHGRRETLKNIHGWLDMGYTPVLPSLERSGGRRFFDRRPRPWAPVTGYRQAGDRVELRQNGRRGPTWYAATGEWTGSLPGGARQSCPVLVVEPGAAAPDPRALADSIAGLALELAWPRRAEMQEDWGTRQVPVGLAQWDRWVIDWERLPLTPEWARQPTPLDQLERMGRYPFPALAGARSLAARYFRGAAEGTVGDRRQKLTAVAAGYERVVDAIEHLLVSLPREDDVGALSLDDLERLARIGEARPLLRAARDGERAAVVALASLLGRPSPPPAATDPLLRRDRGQRLLVWRAKSEDNELSLLLQDDSVHVEVLDGDDPERMDWDVEHAMPQRTGWVVAVQQRAGFGRYAVLEPPTADNGWRLRLLADFDRVRDDNEVEIAVWAVPPQ
jgi:hypothetical protein